MEHGKGARDFFDRGIDHLFHYFDRGIDHFFRRECDLKGVPPARPLKKEYVMTVTPIIVAVVLLYSSIVVSRALIISYDNNV